MEVNTSRELGHLNPKFLHQALYIKLQSLQNTFLGPELPPWASWKHTRVTLLISHEQETVEVSQAHATLSVLGAGFPEAKVTQEEGLKTHPRGPYKLHMCKRSTMAMPFIPRIWNFTKKLVNFLILYTCSQIGYRNSELGKFGKRFQESFPIRIGPNRENSVTQLTLKAAVLTQENYLLNKGLNQEPSCGVRRHHDGNAWDHTIGRQSGIQDQSEPVREMRGWGPG